VLGEWDRRHLAELHRGGTCVVDANQGGNSDYSAAPEVQDSFTVGPTDPGAPTAAKAASGRTTTTTGALTVSYAAPASNGGSAITHYNATCSSTNGGVAKTGTHTGASAAAITVTGVTTGKAYRCSVTATNAKGTGSASSSSAAVVVGAPAAPAVVSATRVAAGQIKVTFLAGVNNGSAITSFTATCTSSNGGATKSGSHTGATPEPITVTGLTGGKSYTCEVTARNARGVSPPSKPSGAVTA
jgi:large repetitive protein